ncbi:hypothetical protein [Sphingomonas hengshuiensis]|uniref:hypothetical protein n=1 Tax=Sphingomonas hengshuiensis TaxID=1609977 RepID=UPI0012B8D992|nr:hypothetical protein [Sphingomonas hengshuiensis]
MRAIKKTRILPAIAALGFALNLSAPALAVTECPGRVVSVYSGEPGNFFIFLDSGSGGFVPPGANYIQASVAIALSALSTGREVLIRFAADGVSCNALRNDMIGIWMK